MTSTGKQTNTKAGYHGRQPREAGQATALREESLARERGPLAPEYDPDVLDQRKSLIKRDLHEGHMDSIAMGMEAGFAWKAIQLPSCPPEVRPSVWIWAHCVLEMQEFMRRHRTTSTRKAARQLGWSTDMYYKALKNPDVAGVLAVWGDAAMELAVGHVRNEFYLIAKAQVDIAQDPGHSKSTQAARWCSELLKYHQQRLRDQEAGSTSGPGASRLQMIMESFSLELVEETTTRKVIVSDPGADIIDHDGGG